MSYKQHLTIENLGPIRECDIDIAPMTVLTGPQSSGKSTISKAIFFFRTIKNDIIQLMIRPGEKNTLRKNLNAVLRNKFLQTFGSSWGMSSDMSIKYQFAADVWIEIRLKDDIRNPNYIWVENSQDIILGSSLACVGKN